MHPELITPDYDASEIEEKAVRRSNLIRAKFGSLAKFLETVSRRNEDETNFEDELCALGKVKSVKRA